MDDVERKIVGMDLVVGLSNVTVGFLVAAGVGVAAGSWWVGLLAAACAAALLAAADRSRAGIWALLGVGGLVIVGVAWPISADAGAVVPVALIGIGVGATVNRFVFGVLRPVPPVRRRRQRSA